MILIKRTCQPASMVLRSLPKDPAMTQICDKLNSEGLVTLGAHTFKLAFAIDPPQHTPLHAVIKSELNYINYVLSMQVQYMQG